MIEQKPNVVSPYPEDYPTRVLYKGINIYNTIPNRYPYKYDRQPYPSLYYDDINQCGVRARSTPKVFPFTNRPWPDYTIYGKPQYYQGLIPNLNLVPAYTFYKSDCFTH